MSKCRNVVTSVIVLIIIPFFIKTIQFYSFFEGLWFVPVQGCGQTYKKSEEKKKNNRSFLLIS